MRFWHGRRKQRKPSTKNSKRWTDSWNCRWEIQLKQSVNVPFTCRYTYIWRIHPTISLFKFWTWVGFCDMFFSLSNHRDSGQAAIFFFFHSSLWSQVARWSSFDGSNVAWIVLFEKRTPPTWGVRQMWQMSIQYLHLGVGNWECQWPQGKFAVQVIPSKNVDQCGLHQISPPPHPPTKKKIHGIFSRHWGRFQSFQSLEGVGVLWRFSLEMFTDFRLVTWSKLLVPDSVLYPLGSWSIDNVNPGRDSQDEVEDMKDDSCRAWIDGCIDVWWCL